MPHGGQDDALGVAEATYAVGDRLLLGDGARWLLVDLPFPAEGPSATALVARLWADAGHPDALDRWTATLAASYGDALPDLAAVDVTEHAYRRATHGRGRTSETADEVVLGLGGPTAAPTGLLRAGTVGASGARVRRAPTAVAPAAVARPGGGRPVRATGTPDLGPPPGDVVTEIPPEILAARGPDVPAGAGFSVVDTSEPAGGGVAPGSTAVRRTSPSSASADHDGATVHRPERAPEPAPQLSQGTSETVLALRCPVGHVTSTTSPVCLFCGRAVPSGDPQRLPRPPLGVLRLPTGEVVPLDRGVVLGRRPSPVPGSEQWPHLVHLPADSTYLSRSHLEVVLDGWHVVARDLGSRGGTTRYVPGRPGERLRPSEDYVLEPGHVLDLADVYEVSFEVLDDPFPAPAPDAPQGGDR